MRPQALLSVLLAAAANIAGASASDASAAGRVASVYIQPLTSPETPPAFLAEIAVPDFTKPGSSSSSSSSSDSDHHHRDPFSSPAEVLSYEAPDLPEGAELVRIGVYDAEAGRWASSSTSVASAENFAKGYSPHFVLTVDGDDYVGVVCRGVRIDAGQTRDFGPQAAVARPRPGAQPAPGRPVVLSPEGKKVVPEEKTFLQKYCIPPPLLGLLGRAVVSTVFGLGRLNMLTSCRLSLQVLVGVGYRRGSLALGRRRAAVIDLVFGVFGLSLFPVLAEEGFGLCCLPRYALSLPSVVHLCVGGDSQATSLSFSFCQLSSPA